MSAAKETAQAALDALKLTISAEFVPWSQSRNKGEKHRSLNWRVTVKRDGRDVLTTDYSAGIAHCPAYNASVKELGGQNCVMRHGAINSECETGFSTAAYDNANSPSGFMTRTSKTPILPDPCDVFYSLSMDSDVLDSPTYEDWASNFGYDADSRKGEAIYRACLEIALKMRAAIGDSGLATLREAFQDY